MKTYVAFGLAIALMVSLCACNKDATMSDYLVEASVDSATGDSTTKAVLTTSVVTDSTTNATSVTEINASTVSATTTMKVNNTSSSAVSTTTEVITKRSIHSVTRINENVFDSYDLSTAICIFDSSEVGSIVDFINGYFITSSGDIYEYTDQLFSNDKHYRKIEGIPVAKKFTADGNGWFAYLSSGEQWYQYFDGKIETSRREEYPFYYTFKKDKLYQIEPDAVYPNLDKPTLLFELSNGEFFESVYEDIGYYTRMSVVKTNKGWYVIKSSIANQDAVDKYVDVQPIYKKELIKLNIKGDVHSVKWGSRGPLVLDAKGNLYSFSR